MRRLGIFCLLAAVLLAGAGLGYSHWDMRQPLPLPEDGLRVNLEPGTSFIRLVRQLDERQALRNPHIVEYYGRLSGLAAGVKAGEYQLSHGMSALDMLELFNEGRVVRYQVTLPEGWTFQQALRHLQAQEALTAALDPEGDIWAQLGIEQPLAKHPEGLFYPDTYDYQRGHRDIDILRRAYHRMQVILAQEWQAREVGLPFETPYEALIMASIVERETGMPEERTRVAGVFNRRLQRNMRLQADPTVAYGVEEAIDRLRRRHLDDASNLYNTYRHHGLPPTPIALPGRAAIHAALNPHEENALFFVARGDGSHVFSETLSEHQRAVRRYQIEQRRSDYRSSPAPTPREK